MAGKGRYGPARAAAWLMAGVLAGCAGPETTRIEEPTPAADETRQAQKLPEPPAQVVPETSRIKRRPAPAARRGKPIPVRPLTVRTECSFKDEVGYGGSLSLAVDQARVARFDASVTIPRRGVCRFSLADFDQTQKLPNIVLSHRFNGCIVRMWEQGERVTVAFEHCESMCSPGAYPYLWPILAYRREGSCG